MKTTMHLVLAVAVILAATANASAWHHRQTYTMPMAPMVPMTVLPTTAPFVPTVASGAGMSLSMSMQGDATMALMLPLILRGIFERLLAPSGPATGLAELLLPQLRPLLAG